jgi:hypothetical protein
MYAWIWRHLPFGLPGKIIGSLLLAGSAMSLLWFVVFPWASPWLEDYLLPFDQSTIGDGSGDDPGTVGGTDPEADPDGEFIGPDGEPIDPHDIPYDTDD